MNGFKLLENHSILVMSPDLLIETLTKSNIIHTVKQIGKSIHIKSMNEGFEIQYIANGSNKNIPSYECSTVFLYINNSKMTNQYQYALPYGLSAKMNIRAVISLLGEPTSKSKFCVECQWEHLGIFIAFKGLSWTDQNLSIDYLYFFTPGGKLGTNCAGCKKHIKRQICSNLTCTNCKIISYCQPSCKDAHYMQHRIFCLDVD